MLTDEQLINRVRTALEYESSEVSPSPGLLVSIREELRGSPTPKRRRPRLRIAHLAPVAALLAVVAVVAVFLGVQSRKPIGSAATHGGFELVYRAEPTPQVPVVTPMAVARAVLVMRTRIAALIPGGSASVSVNGVGTKIFVHVAGGTGINRALLSLVGTGARLELYDWEANALAPSGKTVASLLASQNPDALQLSQGSMAAGPGAPGSGSMSLYAAVTLAAKQHYQASGENARLGPEYFAFGERGSSACRKAAAFYHVPAIVGEHCYLAGPESDLADVYSSLPPGVSRSRVQVLVVKRGTVVLQAIPQNYARAPTWFDPTAEFFVLRDHVALFGNQITNPKQSTDAAGSPAVSFGFTPTGRTEFQHLTAQLARRGALVSAAGHNYNQHFAVAVDTQLISIPYIDYKLYPDGVSGRDGAEIPGGLTIRSARDLATQLRLGALPVHLKLIAEASRR